MPTRSLNSSVLRWPDAASVDAAARAWAQRVAEAHPDVIKIGYFGSYARGDWGVGSDVDLFIIVSHSPVPRYERPSRFDATTLPVPADVWVYTGEEWEERRARSGRFRRTVAEEAVWVFERGP